jgi:hypothetical protein
MYDELYDILLAVSAIYVVCALNVLFFTASSVPHSWPLRRSLARLLIMSCVLRAAEMAMRNKRLLCRHDQPHSASLLPYDDLFRTVVVLLQGAASASSLAGNALLTLFFEEVRRSVRIGEPFKRERNVARLRVVVVVVLIVFCALILIATLFVPFGDCTDIFPIPHAAISLQDDCVFWLMHTWQPDAYYLLAVTARILAAAFFLPTVASSVSHACDQPNVQLKLRWACAIACVALSTVGRASADIYLVVLYRRDPYPNQRLEPCTSGETLIPSCDRALASQPISSHLVPSHPISSRLAGTPSSSSTTSYRQS